jgi:hypothetical protein
MHYLFRETVTPNIRHFLIMKQYAGLDGWAGKRSGLL